MRAAHTVTQDTLHDDFQRRNTITIGNLVSPDAEEAAAKGDGSATLRCLNSYRQECCDTALPMPLSRVCSSAASDYWVLVLGSCG